MVSLWKKNDPILAELHLNPLRSCLLVRQGGIDTMHRLLPLLDERRPPFLFLFRINKPQHEHRSRMLGEVSNKNYTSNSNHLDEVSSNSFRLMTLMEIMNLLLYRIGGPGCPLRLAITMTRGYRMGKWHIIRIQNLLFQ
jgi:hypothetical protein